jgi:hypothetical protein
MKKVLSILFMFVMLFSLISCNNYTGNDDRKIEYHYSKDCIVVIAMGATFEANLEQSNRYRDIWNSLEWKENAQMSSYDYVFEDGHIWYYYFSLDGIFYDVSNDRYTILSEMLKAEINDSFDNLTFVASCGDNL